MLSRIIRSIIFTLIHIYFGIFELVSDLIAYIKKLNKSTDNKFSIKELTKCAQSLNKVPEHLVVIVNEQKFSLSDLTNIVIWCLICGIPYISFYDKKGRVKSREDEFFKEVERRKSGVPGFIKWPNRQRLNGFNDHTYGHSRSHTTNVNLFSNEDGRGKIVQFVQDVCQKKVTCKKKDGEFYVEDVDSHLKSRYKPFPEPQLIWCTGREYVMEGCLPWHIRFSQFTQANITDHPVTLSLFMDLLHKYSKSEQRFGK